VLLEAVLQLPGHHVHVVRHLLLVRVVLLRESEYFVENLEIVHRTLD
jgi:hypothetical protein